MLGKLLKHDFKSLSRMLLPTQLAIFGATIIATLGVTFNMRSDRFSAAVQNSGFDVLRLITGFISGIMLLAIFASTLLIAFIIFQHFYKNFMCDEGYLTFTLPVTTTSLLWSKLISAFLWILISAGVVIVCMCVFVLFGTADSGLINMELLRDLPEVISQAADILGGHLALPIIEFVLFILVGIVHGILQVYLALVLGGVVTQKHKLLAGIGFYFAITIVTGIISSVAQSFINLGLTSSFVNAPFATHNVATMFQYMISAMQPLYIFNIALSLVLSAVFFILTRYFLKNKLNLE
ncbi:MAG: hypothetical protein RSE97_06910 [Oscillospiraceae bacterium]